MAGRELPIPDFENTAAVVITMNPDSGFAERIGALLTQVRTVFVVDNASRAGALGSIEPTARVKALLNGSNLGIATALNQGIEAAAQAGFPWVLLFDQDSRVREDFLARMSEAVAALPAEPPLGTLGANYIDQGRSSPEPLIVPAQAEGRLWTDVSTVITSGSLLAVSLWRKLGRLRDDYFIDHVDHEYCLRARREGYRVAIANQAILYHRIGNSQPKRLLGRTVYPMNASALRWYYVSRNFMLLAREYGLTEPGFCLWAGFCNFKRAIKMTLFEENRGRKWLAIVRGWLASFSHRPGRAPHGRP